MIPANLRARAYKKLSHQHDPKLKPNDPDAPARWAAITAAHRILSDRDRKKFYDATGRAPADLDDFDMSRLSIQDR